MKLLDGVTADTTGSAIPCTLIRGGQVDPIHTVCCYSSDFGGGTVTVQWSPDNSNWFTMRRVDENQAIFTISDVYNVRARGGLVRAKLTGSTTPAALTVHWF
jgi:hypothetical protein